MLIQLSEARQLISSLLEGKFEQVKTGKPFSFVAYRWEESSRNAKKLLQRYNSNNLKSGSGDIGKGLYVSDDIETWGNEYTKCLVKMTVRISNPFVLPKTKHLEGAWDERDLAWEKGFDCVVSVPKNRNEQRQAILFFPQKQITSMKIVSCDSAGYQP